MSDLLPPRTRAALRQSAIRAYAVIGRGGSQWTVLRVGGDTITGLTGPSEIGTITGYAYQEQPVQMRGSIAAVSVADAPWRFAIVDTGLITLQSGDTLQSLTTGRLVFTITGLDQDVLFNLALLEPR